MRIDKTSYTPLLGALFMLAFCSSAGTAGAQPVETKEAFSGPLSAAPGVPPSYRLIGTVGGKAFAGAVFDDSTGVQTFSRLYDKLPDGSQIVMIYDDRIALKRPDGSFFELFTIHDAKAGTSARSQVSANVSVPAPAVAEDRRQFDRPAYMAKPPRREQRAGGGDDRKAARDRRNRDSPVSADGQGTTDPQGSRKQNRSR